VTGRLVALAIFAAVACSDPREAELHRLGRGDAILLDASDRVVAGEELRWFVDRQPASSEGSRFEGQGTPTVRFYPTQPGEYLVVLLAGSGPSVAEVYTALVFVRAY
jgi:hypothetical protein